MSDQDATELRTRGERTRAAVMAAARDLFGDVGFDGATGARIAERAEVSEPSIAFHFGSKAGLLVAVMEAYYDQLVAEMEQIALAEPDSARRLGTFAEWWGARLAEDWTLLSVFGRGGRTADGSPVARSFAACNRRVTTAFDRLVEEQKHAGVVREDVATRLLRDAFFGGAEHLLLGRVATGQPADPAEAVRSLLLLLVQGAGPARRDHTAADMTVHAKLDAILARLEPPGHTT